MRTNALLVVLLAAMSLFAAWGMLPRDAEIAVMKLRAGEFLVAEDLLRQQIDNGNRSLGIMAQMAAVLREKGDQDAAIAILKELASTNQGLPDAWRLLSTELSAAHRHRESLDALLILSGLEPSATLWHQIAAKARLVDDEAQRINALHQLARLNAIGSDERLELAQELARQKRFADAEAIIGASVGKTAPVIDEPSALLLARIVVARGGEVGASEHMMAWLDQATPDQAEALLALGLDSAQSNRTMLQRLQARAASDPRFLRLAAQAIATAGDPGTAARMIARAVAQHSLPGRDFAAATDIVIASGDIDTALALVSLSQPSAEQVLSIIALAEQSGRLADVRPLLAQLDSQVLEREPLLAARLSLAQGDANAARRFLSLAQSRGGLGISEALEVARLESALGQPEAALARLAALAQRPEMPDDALAELGRLFLQFNRVREGLALLDPLRRSRPLPALDASWALLATKARREADVLEWLASSRTTPAVLIDLAYVALDEKMPRLALAAARKLDTATRTPQSVRILALALVQARMPNEALALMGPLVGDDRDLHQPYLDALALPGPDDMRFLASSQALLGTWLNDEGKTALVQTLLGFRTFPQIPAVAALVDWLGRDILRTTLSREARSARLSLLGRLSPTAALPVLRREAEADPERWAEEYVALLMRAKTRNEATSFIEAIVARGTSARLRTALAYSLIEAGGPEAAYPLVRELAESAGGEWLFAFDDLASKLNRRSELIELLRRKSTDMALAPGERRAMAFRLLDLADKPGALKAFQTLAQGQSPETDDARQVLFILGPRPDANGLAWIIARAEESKGPARAQWLNVLVNAGGATQVARVLGTDPPSVGDPAFEPFIAGMIRTGQRQEASHRLMTAAQSLKDGVQLAALAQLAEQANLPGVADQLYAKAGENGHKGGQSLAARARMAQASGRRDEALKLWSEAIALTPERADLRYQYAEALLALKRSAEARAEFARVLSAVSSASETAELRRLRAFTLFRLGREPEARQEFERLLSERPADKALRADYAGLLIDAGDADAARRVLAR